MSYNNSHIINLAELKQTSQVVNSQLDTLSARIDANVTASTDSNADYAAEVVDARVDECGNPHGSAGSAFRNGQERLQRQINQVACAVLELAALIGNSN